MITCAIAASLVSAPVSCAAVSVASARLPALVTAAPSTFVTVDLSCKLRPSGHVLYSWDTNCVSICIHRCDSPVSLRACTIQINVHKPRPKVSPATSPKPPAVASSILLQQFAPAPGWSALPSHGVGLTTVSLAPQAIEPAPLPLLLTPAAAAPL